MKSTEPRKASPVLKFGGGFLLLLMLSAPLLNWWSNGQGERAQKRVQAACETEIYRSLGKVSISSERPPLNLGDRWTWTVTAQGTKTNQVLCLVANPGGAAQVLVGDQNGKF